MTTRKQNGQGKVRTLRDAKQVEAESRDRFVRLAPARTERVLKALDTLENCAGPGYVYSPEEAERIIAAVEARLDGVRSRFAHEKRDGRAPFTL